MMDSRLMQSDTTQMHLLLLFWEICAIIAVIRPEGLMIIIFKEIAV